MKVVVLHADLANLAVLPLQEQHAPARLVAFIFVQAAVQAPVVVVPPAFSPYVGSIDTVLPVLLNDRYRLLEPPTNISFFDLHRLGTRRRRVRRAAAPGKCVTSEGPRGSHFRAERKRSHEPVRATRSIDIGRVRPV
jgi:hypothetical protein